MSTTIARTARSLHVIHVENFTAGGLLTDADAARIRATIEDQVPTGPDDLVVVACHPANAFAVASAWPTARTLWGRGPHGAAEALTDVLTSESVADRFDRVTLASGSGAFVPAVAALTAAGCHVTLLAPYDGCSRRLELTAHEIHLLDTSATAPHTLNASRAA